MWESPGAWLQGPRAQLLCSAARCLVLCRREGLLIALHWAALISGEYLPDLNVGINCACLELVCVCVF